MNGLQSFLRQPSTLMAAGCLIGAAVYWATGNASLALASVAVVPGAVSDHTSQLLTKIEGVEDAVRPTTIAAAKVAAQASVQQAAMNRSAQ